MEKKITEQESLRIINEMIAEARNNFNGESAKTMEFMGYAVIAISMLNILLLNILEHPYNAYYVWLLMFPISLVNSYFARKREKKAKVVMHVEKIIDMIWKTYSIMIIVFLSTVFTWAYFYNYWVLTVMIMPCILLFTAFATFITGVACKFKPYRQGGIIFGLGAVACIGIGFSSYYAILQFVILIFCMILGFIVPSIQLKKILK